MEHGSRTGRGCDEGRWCWMFFQCFPILTGWGASLPLSLSLLISTCLMHTDSNEKRICSSCAFYFECVWVGLLGTETLDISTEGLTSRPPPSRYSPGLGWQGFPFLSEVYYLLPWLVFNSLLTSNRFHRRRQLHPLCLPSSKCKIGFLPVGSSCIKFCSWSYDCRGEMIKRKKKDKIPHIVNSSTFYPTAGLVWIALV